MNGASTVAVRSIPVSRSREPKRREAQRHERSSALDRGALFRRLFAILVLAVCVLTALLAVPDLRPVLHEVGAMNPALVIAAVVLELASCLSFVVIFRAFFPEIPKRVAREPAWSQMGSGALLPGGGVGSRAAGGWWLHLVGMPTREIVQRSSALFFFDQRDQRPDAPLPPSSCCSASAPVPTTCCARDCRSSPPYPPRSWFSACRD